MRFFVLQQPEAGRGDAVTDYRPVDGSRMGDAPRCAVCRRFLGMLPLLPPVRVELEAWGSRWGDLAFGPGDQISLSEKLKSLFIKAGLVGFTRFDPIEIVKTKTRSSGAVDLPDYGLRAC